MKPIVLLLIGFLLGVLMLRFYEVRSTQHIYTDGEVLHGTFRLSQEPQDVGNTQQFRIVPPHSMPIVVTTALFPRLGYGDTITITGKLHVIVLENTRQRIVMRFPRITRVADTNSIPHLIGGIRSHINLVFQRSLSPLQASLLEGIVFGIKNDMPSSFLDKLRREGLTHIIAASGMNISFVAGALASLFSLVFPRKIGLILAIGGVICYGLLAGFEPSILRAMLMAIIALSASFFGRQNISLFSLGVTGYVMLIIRPENLTDVGFQLSFMATIGIFVVKPLLEGMLFRKTPQLTDHVLLADVTTTLAAQITTLPILLTNFGQYNLLSVLTNLCVLWTIPPLMIMGGIGAVLSFVSQFLAQIVLAMSIPLLLYFIWMVEWWSNFAVIISVASFPVVGSIAYYTSLLAVLTYRYERGILHETTH